MSPLRSGVVLLSALLIIFGTTTSVFANEDDSDDDGIVETVEELEPEEVYHSPQVNPHKVYFTEHFDNVNAFKKRWVESEAKKQGVDETIAKYDGKWEISIPSRKILKDDLGLVLTTEAKHAAISALLERPFQFLDRPLIVQYEVTMQEGQNCGGAYLKLLSRGTNTKADLKQFHDQTPYTIMFGPDKCGNDNKLHFIFRYQNPKNGSFEEKHSKKPSQRLDDIYKDKEPHLYTLVLRPDNTYSVLVDNKEVNAGSLLEDFTPPVNPPEEISDPNDTKPQDWDEREKIVDPSATKPEDWDEEAPAQIVDPNAAKPDGWLDDEPETIPDPEAQKPADWDEEMDGTWEAPLIDNPACAAAPGCGPWAPPVVPNADYKGIWRAPLIANPNYKGKWSPRKIPNPEYFHDDQPFRMTPIHAIGFELWSMSPALLFDNLIVTDDPLVLQQWTEQTFALKRAKLARDSDSVLDRSMRFAADNPWIYAVVIVVAFLFVGLFAYLCCTDSKQDLPEDPKKTDALQEDDPRPEGEAEAEEAEAEAEEEGGEAEQAPPSKAGLESKREESPPMEHDGAGDGQRKRKPRKE